MIFNTNDACTANRKVNGNTHTMMFHVDDLMSSHVDSKVNNKFSVWLNEQCGECGKVKATRGNEHDHLGMAFRFKDGKVEINMVECAINALKEFPVKLREMLENIMPAGVDLFREDNSEKMNKEMRTMFHRTVVQGLFVCKRARPDTQPMIAVLCTGVKSPGQKDWNKLVRLMKYLHSTKDDVLTLDARNGVHNVEWSMDSAFGVHPDFKSHVRGTVKFKEGHGSVVNVSTKQKLNTESSAVAELMGVDQVPPSVLWAPSFLKEQSYKV